jgi:hypothetical protein
MENPAPTVTAEVMSPEWLTEALSIRYPATVVRSVDIVEVRGPVATKARFAVDYETAPDEAPLKMCAKGFFGSDRLELLVASGVAEREARFYMEVAPHTTVRVPRLDYGGVDGGHGVIITEDLVDSGCTFLGALVHRTVDQTRETIDQLARLHAPFWNGAGLELFPWLKREFHKLAAKPYLPLDQQQALMDDPRKEGVPEDVLSARRLFDGMAALSKLTEPLPDCVVHGDFHAGNLYIDAAGRPGVLDWQIIQRAHWALDVSYHIGSVLTTEDREAAEQDLLRHYLDRLRAHGVEPPSWDEAWVQYRVHMIYGYYQWAVTRFVRPVEITHEFFRRLGKAVHSLDSFGLLGV